MKARKLRLFALGLAVSSVMSSAPVFAMDAEETAVVETIQEEEAEELPEVIEEEAEAEAEAAEENGEAAPAEETAEENEEAAPAEEKAEENEEAAPAEEKAEENEEAAQSEEAAESKAEGETDASAQELSDEDKVQAALEDVQKTLEDAENRKTDSGEQASDAAKEAAEEEKSADIMDEITENVKEQAIEKTKALIEDTVISFVRLVPGGSMLEETVKGLIGFLNDKMISEAGLGNEEKPGLSLKDIQSQISGMEDRILKSAEDGKKHTTTAVVFNSFGTEFNNLNNKTESLRLKINAIREDGRLSDAEKSNMIAGLLDDSYGKDVIDQLISTANIFCGESSNDARTRDLFEIVYSEAAENSMFTGEVLNSTASFLRKRLCNIIEAQAVLSDVLNEVEKNGGKGKADVYRKRLLGDLIGTTDENGEKNKKGILDKFSDYFSKDRTVFINKDENNGKKLDKVLGTVSNDEFRSNYQEAVDKYDSRGNKEGYELVWRTDEKGKHLIATSALSADEIRKLQSHVNAKGQSMIDYLSDVGFNIDNLKGKSNVLSTLGMSYDEEHHGFLWADCLNNYYSTGYRMDQKNAGEIHSSYRKYDDVPHFFTKNETIILEHDKDQIVVFQAAK